MLGVSLDAVTPERAHAARLLAAVERNNADAGIAGLSMESRFDVGYAADKVRVLDALRKQRNLTDYSGEPVPEISGERVRRKRAGTRRACEVVVAEAQAGAALKSK